MCIEARRLGMKKIVVPIQNMKEASIVKDIEVLGAHNLQEVVKYINGEQELTKAEENMLTSTQRQTGIKLDFSQVKGQENVKRALEVAASGGHNCLMIGMPGSGKTMMVRRLPTILPDLNFDEALETTKIHSVSGTLEKDVGLITTRPFRAPHHTISYTSLIGGGRIPKPGEVSLAHNGVLFLDELPEFNKKTLEVLRGPLEDRIVTISRVNATLTYPCNFMFVASMNPCPCGFYGSKEKQCTCTEQMINKYMEKISGPLLDRIDIQIEVSAVKYQKLKNDKREESSEDIKKRVNKARQRSEERR